MGDQEEGRGSGLNTGRTQGVGNRVKAVILHGGQGTRLRPLTHTGPKQLIKVAGKPVSQWGIEALREVGVREFAIILGDNFPEQVVDYYRDGSSLGIEIIYIYQGKARGLADAVYRTRDFVGEDDFIVYLGDNVVLEGIDFVAERGSFNRVLLAKVPNPNRFGVAVTEGERVVRLVEKPKEFVSDLALVGVYRFTPEVFRVIEGLRPSWRGELEITDAIQSLVDRGVRVGYRTVQGWWKDTGTPEDLLEANMTLMDRFNIQSLQGDLVDSSVVGRVVVQPGASVRRSTLRGPVLISSGAVVEDSVIGPYTSIGERARVIQSKVVNSIIMEGSSVENLTLEDSILGRNAVMSKGKRRFSGERAVMGENSRVEL